MKRFRLLTILLLLSASVWSQNFRLGFQASPHVSWMNSTRGDILNHETKPGVKYGLEADFFIAGYPRYIINSGLFVSNHSFSARYNLDTPFFINKAAFDTLVTLHYRMNYIEVPLEHQAAFGTVLPDDLLRAVWLIELVQPKCLRSIERFTASGRCG
jgi:hypothetical protein